ncbi:MAG: hypothetical protein ACNA7J_10050 [Wenzhouxiangella sp.]
MRIQPTVKAGLRAIAERERRSIANMIEVMIRDYCGRNAVPIDDSLQTEYPATRKKRP